MTRFRTKALLTAVLFLPLMIPPCRAQSASEADSAAIKQKVAEMAEAFNHHDTHALAALFAEDADFTNLRGVSRHGRKAIESYLTPVFAGVLKDATRTDSIRGIRMLTPTLAAVDSDNVVTGVKAPNGSDAPAQKGLMNLILTKQGGQWLVAIFHEMDLPPAPPAAGATK